MAASPNARSAGMVRQSTFEGHFFHWPLAFPEVFATGGFDVILGNPPFLGGLKISTEFGDKYRQWLSTAFDPFPGTADLCATFFRRAFKSLNLDGRLGLIATNTISQGDTRESGLACLKREGGTIVFARRFVKWPGTANLEVTLTSLSRQHEGRPLLLDGVSVSEISSRLDAEPEAEPRRLCGNRRKAHIGCYVFGMGFTMDASEAQRLEPPTHEIAIACFRTSMERISMDGPISSLGAGLLTSSTGLWNSLSNILPSWR